MKPSVRYRDDAEALRAFCNAYVNVINASQPREGLYGSELVANVPPPEWSRLRSEAAHAAGAATTAYHRNGGGTFTLKNAAVIMQNIDPISNWDMSLRDPDFSAEAVVAAVEQTIGLAERRAAEAEQREKGIVGLIAAFLRWPSTLREAVGPGHAAQRRAAGAFGFIGQVIVCVIGTAIATGVVAGLLAIWRTVR